MKKRYEVRYYEYGLTNEKVKTFSTKIAAVMFAAYKEAYEYTKATIKEIEDERNSRNILV